MTSQSLRRFIRKYPVLRSILQRVYRSGQYLGARLLSRLRHDDLFLIAVQPARIQMTVKQSDPTLTGNAVWHVGSVAGGDWDLGGVPVAMHGHVAEILRAFVQHKQPLASIPQYQANVSRIEQGELIDSCTTAAEYEARWQRIASLYESIKKGGYKTQVELGSDNPLDEIRVQIGRRGEILFEEGLHRLAIAQLLELPSVPVLVTRRHRDWAALREAVLRIILQRGFIHQPFDHPDLDSLPQQYGNELAESAMYGHERWHFIEQSLPRDAGTVLDIGAYFGYFDQRLEPLGFDCYAVEPDRENLAVLHLYRTMQGRTFTVWPHSIFRIERYDFDVVLALNIFHHLVRTRDDHDQLVQFLQKLNCQALYFEPDDNAGIEAYRQFSEAEFVDFILTHTGLQKAQYLGRAKEGRGLYLLTRK